MKLFAAILRGGLPDNWRQPDRRQPSAGLSPEAAALCRALLVRDPGARLAAARKGGQLRLKGHAFFGGLEKLRLAVKHAFVAKGSELKIVPVAMFIAKLECEHINLRHHGMGVKGARALAAALLANSKIRSLNLGDNWFGDEGVLAVAEVACLPALRATARPGARARPCRSHYLSAPATLRACHRTARRPRVAGPGLQLGDHVARPFGQPHWPARR